jgi:riboflavin kinase/FMN adenylyltransferase
VKRIYFPEKFKPDIFEKEYPQGAVYALGFFDGVHIAHRALISEAKKQADALSLPLGIFTFASEGVGIKPSVGRIYSTEEKLSVIESLGADFAIICDFSEVRNMSAEEFVGLLSDKLLLKFGVCGFNFRFGKGAAADADFLKCALDKKGKGCLIIDEISHGGSSVSATLIRRLIESRQPMAAAELLGLPFFIVGEVVHGRGEGKGFGFPTVNTSFAEGALIPAVGVYLTAVERKGKIYTAITNVGSCPTFGERECHAETYIIDFDGDLYGESVRIYFIEYLRDEIVFGGAAELTAQLELDKAKAKSLATEELWHRIGLK